MSFHIAAKRGEIAKHVLLPGDPLRAKRMAEAFLDDVFCYNEVRGMLGFTGTYKGLEVSVQGGGMGMASNAIYIEELLRDYDVETIIRVGTSGSIHKDVHLGTHVIAASASTDSEILSHYFPRGNYSAVADHGLVRKAEDMAEKLGLDMKVGNILSTDIFNHTDPNRWDAWSAHNIICIEMESAILFTLAARYKAKALTLLTVTDSTISGESFDQMSRETSMGEITQVALETLLNI